MRTLKLLAAFLLMFAFTASQAKCLRIADAAKLPPLIEVSECMELAGGEITGQHVVRGRLFTKAGTLVTLKSGASLEVQEHGQIILRSALYLEPQSLIAVKGGKFEVHGELYGAGARMEAVAGSVRLAAPCSFTRGSELKLVEKQSSLTISSYLSLENSLLKASSSGVKNQGALTLRAQSALELADASLFENHGTAVVDDTSALRLFEHSSLLNHDSLTIDGSVFLDDMASFENYDRLGFAPTAALFCQDLGKFFNARILDLKGRWVLTARCCLQNSGSFKITREGEIFLKDEAKFLDEGALDNEGRILTEGKASFNRIRQR